ncbi:MAG TPA: hypothetical protein PKE06_09410 [Flavilitoribacter sp.]|nr:hypothetical protein [Flavilitoribacter sp.]
MKRLPGLLMLIASGALLTLFLFPIWRITLIAPQYPDGVNMYIWINKIGGDGPGVLQNVNILNHYVGMKFIEPDSIPELKYFPAIILIMGGLALLTALLNKSWVYFSWGILMTVLAIAGIYDFYLWEYDYGHNLSPQAPIKIPGAFFQPPLLGTRHILNFIAESFPHWGGYLAGFAIFLSFTAWWIRSKLNKNEKKHNDRVDAPVGSRLHTLV